MSKENNQEFSITRILNAPRSLVFKVWTDPEHLMQWWGPKGFKIHTAKLDLRPNGIFHYHLQTPEGQKMWGKFVYHEIIEPEKLVFTVSFSDENCGITRHPMSNTWPLEVLSTIIFTEQAGKTTLSMKGAPVNASPEEIKTFVDGFAGMQQGWAGTMGQLEDYLASIQV